jgi:HSP20 family protein
MDAYGRIVVSLSFHPLSKEVIMAGNMTRFNPMRDIARFDPFRNFEDLFGEFPLMTPWGHMEEQGIRMDITETDQAYTVNADIPGVKKEDIKIEIDGNKVTIRAEVKQFKEEKDEQIQSNVIRSERYYGQQYRSFSLPQPVDDSTAEAKYQDGVLRLTLPKKGSGNAKQVSVQ